MTNIQRRIGYSSGGGGHLYTHASHWDAHTREHVLDHLRRLFTTSILPKSQECTYRNRLLTTVAPPVPTGFYVVVHPCSGKPALSWPTDNWISFVRHLCDRHIQVVVTGKGKRDLQVAERLSRECPDITNLVNRLTWVQFATAIRHAGLVVSMDTSCVHVASAADVPVIALYSERSTVSLWRPYGHHVKVLEPAHGVHVSTLISTFNTAITEWNLAGFARIESRPSSNVNTKQDQPRFPENHTCKKPKDGGRYWARTSDLLGVNQTL